MIVPLMKPSPGSRTLLGIARSKAKMYEYGIPLLHHIAVPKNGNPERLFPLTIGMLGDEAAHQLDASQGPLAANGTSRESARFANQFFNAYVEGKFDLEA